MSASDVAQLYLGLGDQENALSWLETAYQDRSNWLVWAGVDPVLDRLRGNARFEDLLQRVGLRAR